VVAETENKFDRWYIFVLEELDDVALFEFHIFDTFALTERPLSA
jgi:hypothetical protein